MKTDLESDLELDDRITRTVCVTVSHPPDWALEDVADELFEWSENIEDTRLVVHVVTGEQEDEPVPDWIAHQQALARGDDLLLVESGAETLAEFEAEMAALREKEEGAL
tara:strand:+ start:814 stop:1140 length:327 start_codon:yes stop_codon:yes gene_type:complete